MKIAVDLTQIPANKTGAGVHALYLVEEMIRLNESDSGVSLYFFVQDDDQQFQELIQAGKGKNCYSIPLASRWFRKLALRFLFEQVLFPRRCKKLGIDVILSLHYTMPYLTRMQRVVIMPDFTFFLFPQMHQRIKLLYFRTLIPLTVRKSTRLITVSHSTKKDLLRFFPYISEEKVQVLNLGVEPDHPARNNTVCLQTYALQNKKYFLYVGTL